MHVLDLEGSPYEVGLEHGRKLSELIQAYYSFHRFMLQRIPKETISATIPQVENALRRIYPDAIDEMRGIADASGLKLEDIMLINFASEIGRRALAGCTAFVAVKSATENGLTIMGKTRDLRYQAYYPFQVAMKVRVTGKIGVFLAEAFVGRVVTGCGINEHGLGLMLNVVNINDFDDSIGIQRSFLARLILEKSKSVSEAVKQFAKYDLAYCGGNYLLCDNQGNCALIEKSHARQAVKGPNNGIIVTTNHFTDPNMTKYMGGSSKSSALRFNQMTSLLNSSMGKINVELAKSFLRNHAQGDSFNSICRHDSIGVNTVSAYIIDATNQRMHIADGHPCRFPFKTYNHKKVLPNNAGE